MSQSFYKIWLHVVFSTKQRRALIKQEHEKVIYKCIADELKKMSCPVSIINGMPDHVHILYLQNPKITVADTVKQIKGLSSHFINHNNIMDEKFAWQNGYGVFSVSNSNSQKVYKYIRSQKRTS